MNSFRRTASQVNSFLPVALVLDSVPHQLNATANVPGTFTYSPTLGTVLQHGPPARVLSCTFTRTDTTSYKIVTATTTIDVWKAQLITW